MIRYVLILVIGLSSGMALAGGDDSSYRPPERIVHNPPLDAKPIIAHCWEISDALRTGTTNSMRQGFLKTALCLEQAIAEHAAALFARDEAGRARIRKQLDQIHTGYGGLYWSIFNDVKTCKVGCGTMYFVFHNAEIAELYEKILTDIIAQRNKYGT